VENVTRFFPTWRLSVRLGVSLAAATVGGVLLAVVFIPRLLGQVPKVPFASTVAPLALITSLAMFALAGAFYGFGRLWPVRLTPEGVIGTTGIGFKHLARWQDIERVVSYTVYGLRMLRLEGTNLKTTTTPMYIDDLSGVRSFISLHAGPDHPLSKWLDVHAPGV